jgi:hypothetical protein
VRLTRVGPTSLVHVLSILESDILKLSQGRFIDGELNVHDCVRWSVDMPTRICSEVVVGGVEDGG